MQLWETKKHNFQYQRNIPMVSRKDDDVKNNFVDEISCRSYGASKQLIPYRVG